MYLKRLITGLTAGISFVIFCAVPVLAAIPEAVHKENYVKATEIINYMNVYPY